MPRTGLSSQELVEKALEIAERHIRRHGIEKFRLSDIARELGVSHAALYNHLPDKAALVDAISARWLREVDAALEVVALGELPVKERIGAWFRKLHQGKLDKVRNDPELYRPFNMASETNKPFVRAHLDNLRAQLLGMVRETGLAVQPPSGGPPSPEDVVAVLFEATISFHHPHLVWEHRDEEREELLQAIVATVLAGLQRLD